MTPDGDYNNLPIVLFWKWYDVVKVLFLKCPPMPHGEGRKILMRFCPANVTKTPKKELPLSKGVLRDPPLGAEGAGG
jgi:hypothetical protein